MRERDVPQEVNALLEGHRKAVYRRRRRRQAAHRGFARLGGRGDRDPPGGRTSRALRAGGERAACSPDRARRSSTTCIARAWTWRFSPRRRAYGAGECGVHFRPEVFARLPQHLRQRYAAALGLEPVALDQVD
jgi:hypothetical protein